MKRKIIIILTVLCLTACGNSDSAAGEAEVVSASDNVSEVISATESTEKDETSALEEVADSDIQLVEIVPPCRPSMGITLELPAGWSYELAQTCDEPTSSSSVYIKLDDSASEGRIAVEYVEGGIGVCGTGLEQKSIDFNGYKASQGTYSANDVWDFIMLEDEYFGCVILNDTELYKEYSETIDDILSTVRFEYYE